MYTLEGVRSRQCLIMWADPPLPPPPIACPRSGCAAKDFGVQEWCDVLLLHPIYHVSCASRALAAVHFLVSVFSQEGDMQYGASPRAVWSICRLSVLPLVCSTFKLFYLQSVLPAICSTWLLFYLPSVLPATCPTCRLFYCTDLLELFSSFLLLDHRQLILLSMLLKPFSLGFI